MSAAGTYGGVGRQGADWLLSTALATGDGLTWPSTVGEEPNDSLYAGTPGVIVALVTAHHATGDARYLDAAQAAGRHISAVAAEMNPGLYTGIAGVGFALASLGDRGGVRHCVELLAARAAPDGAWDTYTDIIVGAAGTGLFLLSVGEIDLAASVGVALIARAIGTESGSKWAIDATGQRLMPNFSHGTAGISYFLATLAEATGSDAFLDAALRGASYLLSVARTENDTCAVFHFEPGGEDLYPLGWCHGPTGLARLFHRLALTTGDVTWSDWRDRCANTVRHSGIPQRAYPGFWDNLARCCGSTGVAEFFLDLHRVTGNADDLAFARTMADDIVDRAEVDESGARWSNVEHRSDPPELPPEIGAMQGAAGISSFLLRLDGYLKGDDWHIAWPDSPFSARNQGSDV